MSIPFIQYLRPDGRQRSVLIERPHAIEEKAQRILAAGYRFEVEELQTLEASLTIYDPENEKDEAIEVVPNGPAVPAAVDRLIEEFCLKMGL